MRNRHLFLIDLLLLAPLPFVAVALRMESTAWPSDLGQAVFMYAALALAVRLGVTFRTGLYRFLWRHASLVELERLMFAALAAGVMTMVLGGLLLPTLNISTARMPLSALALDAMLAAVVLAIPRLGTRYAAWRPTTTPRRSPRPTIIVGAGNLGQSVFKTLHSDMSQAGLVAVAFADDNVAKTGQSLGGVPVVGNTESLAHIIESHHATEVIIAVPEPKSALIRRVVDACASHGITPRIVPGVRDLISGRVSVESLRRVEIADLLRRDPITTDLTAVGDLVSNHVVMVTGAGGSIGSELCRQIAALKPTNLVVLDHSENQVFEIHNELLTVFPDIRVTPVIADLRDRGRINDLFHRLRPSVVFHAAAHKHVPLMEENVVEAVTNNVLGTRNAVEAALDVGTSAFVLISTDKAVRPTSVMGCSKRVAEQVVYLAAKESGRNFVSVRFGNVLGSRGSVIPTFLEQIKSGGPVTVTHPEMRRYFMTIPEAVQLVLQAGALGRSGEVFALDMGEPVKIVDLARDLIRLSGLEEGADIEIKFSGIRPGEKLYEEVFFGHEAVEATSHPKVLRTPADAVDESLEAKVEAIIRSALSSPSDSQLLRAQLRSLVPDFHVPELPPPSDRLRRDSDERRLKAL